MNKMFKILPLVGFLGFAGLIGGYESTYNRTAICSNFSDNIYTFTDETGNNWEWEAENTDNFTIGTSYILVMDDNHTTSIYDDWIKKIKK